MAGDKCHLRNCLLPLSKLSQSLPPTDDHLTCKLKRTPSGKSLNKKLHPQNRIKRKQKALKSFEKICLTIERGNSFGCDAMALEMNKLGQEQINLKIIAEKGTVPCPRLWEI